MRYKVYLGKLHCEKPATFLHSQLFVWVRCTWPSSRPACSIFHVGPNTPGPPVFLRWSPGLSYSCFIERYCPMDRNQTGAFDPWTRPVGQSFFTIISQSQQRQLPAFGDYFRLRLMTLMEASDRQEKPSPAKVWPRVDMASSIDDDQRAEFSGVGNGTMSY